MEDTGKFARVPRPSPSAGEDSLETKVSRIDGTLVDVRSELDDVATMQKKTNKVLLQMQGDDRRLEKLVVEGFRAIKKQNDEILKLLRSEARREKTP